MKQFVLLAAATLGTVATCWILAPQSKSLPLAGAKAWVHDNPNGTGFLTAATIGGVMICLWLSTQRGKTRIR